MFLDGSPFSNVTSKIYIPASMQHLASGPRGKYKHGKYNGSLYNCVICLVGYMRCSSMEIESMPRDRREETAALGLFALNKSTATVD